MPCAKHPRGASARNRSPSLRDSSGELLAEPVEWNPAEGPAVRILIHVPRKARAGAPAPGLGDRALVRADPIRNAQPGEPAYAGRIIKLIAKSQPLILGIFKE